MTVAAQWNWWRCRWRLHLDLEDSVEAMLCQQQQQQQQRCKNAQLRLREASTPAGLPFGRNRVQFETPEAAQQALEAAEAIAAAAAAAASSADCSRLVQGAARQAVVGSNGARQAFAGGWLVDLLHAAVHRSIASKITS